MIYLKSIDLVKKGREQLYYGTPISQKVDLTVLQQKIIIGEIEINRPGRETIMNNIAGAIGNIQLKKLSKFIDRRKEIHRVYYEELSKYDWLSMPPALMSDTSSSYYFFDSVEKRDDLARFVR